MKTMMIMTLALLSLSAFASGSESLLMKRNQLLNLKVNLKEQSALQVKTLNQSIKMSLKNERIEEAQELMMERDLEILNTMNKTDRIDRLVKKINA